MTFSHIMIFVTIAVLGRIQWGTLAVYTIDEIRTHSRYYPKAYMLTPRWVKKRCNVKQQLIPKYLYFEILLSRFYIVMCPINLIICIITKCDVNAVYILLMFQVCLTIMNLIFFVITTFIFKR